MLLGLSLGAIAGLSILVNFAYQWYVLTTLGPGQATDALFAGTMVPQLVLVIASGSLNYVLIPAARRARSPRAAHGWPGPISRASVSRVSGWSAVLALTAAWWVPLTVPGFSPANAELAVHLTRVQLVATAFTAVTGVEVALHHAKQHFLRAEGAGVVASLAGLALHRVGAPADGHRRRGLGHRSSGPPCQMLLLTFGMGAYRAPHWSDPSLALGGATVGAAHRRTALLQE